MKCGFCERNEAGNNFLITGDGKTPLCDECYNKLKQLKEEGRI